MTPQPYHSFSRLVLTISESSLADIRTDHRFELRSNARGADVWRSSILHAAGGTCESDERFIGSLTSRQVIELLVEIERSGLYEALPAMGIVAGTADPDAAPIVSMQLVNEHETRDLIDQVQADAHSVRGVVRAIRDAIDGAQERALTVAG